MNNHLLPAAVQEANEVALSARQRVFTQGQSADNYLLVIKGRVKVFARSSEGKEVVLYRVRDGEMCILTTACLLGHTVYPAEAVTETDTVARIIPAPLFNQLLNDSQPFRQFVFEGLSRRLAEVMLRLEQMVLESVHHRLADFLLRSAGSRGEVGITHEQLAIEIGTAREVVSRHLGAMEKDGLIRTQRGKVVILDSDGLVALG